MKLNKHSIAEIVFFLAILVGGLLFLRVEHKITFVVIMLISLVCAGFLGFFWINGFKREVLVISSVICFGLLVVGLILALSKGYDLWYY